MCQPVPNRQPGPTSTITVGEESSPITIEYGEAFQITFDPSKLYIIGLLKDRSLGMTATFTRDTKNPFPLIQEWLEENFNPGPSAAAKENSAAVMFLISNPKSDESAPMSRAYLAMIDNITTFRLHSYAILEGENPRNLMNNSLLSLNLVYNYPFIVGHSFHKMDSFPVRGG